MYDNTLKATQAGDILGKVNSIFKHLQENNPDKAYKIYQALTELYPRGDANNLLHTLFYNSLKHTWTNNLQDKIFLDRLSTFSARVRKNLLFGLPQIIIEYQEQKSKNNK